MKIPIYNALLYSVVTQPKTHNIEYKLQPNILRAWTNEKKNPRECNYIPSWPIYRQQQLPNADAASQLLVFSLIKSMWTTYGQGIDLAERLRGIPGYSYSYF